MKILLEALFYGAVSFSLLLIILCAGTGGDEGNEN